MSRGAQRSGGPLPPRQAISGPALETRAALSLIYVLSTRLVFSDSGVPGLGCPPPFAQAGQRGQKATGGRRPRQDRIYHYTRALPRALLQGRSRAIKSHGAPAPRAPAAIYERAQATEQTDVYESKAESKALLPLSAAFFPSPQNVSNKKKMHRCSEQDKGACSERVG